MRPAALLLLVPACGLFKGKTVAAGKDAIQALPDLLAQVKALLAAVGQFIALWVAEVLPKLAALLTSAKGVSDVTGKIGDWVYLALIALGLTTGHTVLATVRGWLGWKAKRRAAKSA